MTEGAFFALIPIAVAVFLIGKFAYPLLKKYSLPLSFAEAPNLKEIATWVQRDAEVKKRLAVTLGVLLLVGAGSFIPIPGVNVRAILDVFRELSYSLGEGHSGMISMLDMVTGGAMSRMTLFSLGIAPFFSACILIQIALAVIPSLKRASFGGEGGREQLAEHTYSLTIILSLLSAYFASFGIENSVGIFHQAEILTIHGWPFRLLAMATLTGGTVLLLFLAGLITRHGLGNGVAIIAVAGFPVKLFLAGRDLFAVAQETIRPVHGIPLLMILLLFFVILTVGIYLVSQLAATITLNNQQGDKLAVYLPPSLVGKIPTALAVNVLFLPIYLASFTGAHEWAEYFTRTPILFNAAYILLILLFTYLYAPLVLKPHYFIDLTKKYGYAPSEGKEPDFRNHLRVKLLKLLAITGLFLAGIAVLPDLVMALLKLPPRIASVIGGVQLLVVVGVFSDIVRQLVFLKERQESGTADWTVAYTAFDSVEATIKAQYLEGRGIRALVEPLRYTWGMPIRTIVDQYRIYTPTNRQEEARSLVA